MRRGGFTLLETMIVVLIVTAISAIFLPSLAGRATASRLGQASRAIESGAALAGAEAMSRGVIIAFVAERWDAEWVLWAEEVEPGGGMIALLAAGRRHLDRHLGYHADEQALAPPDAEEFSNGRR